MRCRISGVHALSSLFVFQPPWFSSFSANRAEISHRLRFFQSTARRLPMNKFWCHYHFNRSISLKFGDVCKQKICFSGAQSAQGGPLIAVRGMWRAFKEGETSSLSLLRIQLPLFASFLVFVHENEMIRCGSQEEKNGNPSSAMLERCFCMLQYLCINIMTGKTISGGESAGMLTALVAH